MFFGIFGWKKHRWTSKTDFQTLCWCFAEIFVSAAGMLVPAAEMLACGCRWGTSSKVTSASATILSPNAFPQSWTTSLCSFIQELKKSALEPHFLSSLPKLVNWTNSLAFNDLYRAPAFRPVASPDMASCFNSFGNKTGGPRKYTKELENCGQISAWKTHISPKNNYFSPKTPTFDPKKLISIQDIKFP